MADAAAAEAITEAGPTSSVRPSTNTIYTTIARYYREQSSDVMTSALENRDALATFPEFKYTRYPDSTRKQQEIIHNLRLDTFRNFPWQDRNSCTHCGELFDTVHYLLRCPFRYDLRQPLLRALTNAEFAEDYKTQAQIILARVPQPHTLQHTLHTHRHRTTQSRMPVRTYGKSPRECEHTAHVRTGSRDQGSGMG